MPTSSTARLLAKKQRQQAEKQQQQQQQFQNDYQYSRRPSYYRPARPKSCKYDSYRLRSRKSVVDEHLFGEPLKNQLILARSRSMEAIAASNAQQQQQQQQQQQRNPDRIFYVGQTGGSDRQRRRQERPKTALATMRVRGDDRDPEFDRGRRQQQSSNHMGFAEPPPLILTRREFEMILEASKVLSPSERAAIRQKELEEAEAAARASEERRRALEAAAVGLTDEKHSPTLTSRERAEADGHVLERARMLEDEALPEVKRLNGWITQAKCHAIRDMQMREKQKRLDEMAEADRHLEEEMEEERKKALQMAEERAKHLDDFHKDYRAGLKEQKEELEALRLLEIERQEAEARIREEIEREEREKEERAREAKAERARMARAQMAEDVEEARRRREADRAEADAEEARILALQKARREAEIEAEREAKAKKREEEREKARIKGEIELEQERRKEREELRLIRQQEAQERKWRERKLASERARAQREEEIRVIREEQIRQKRLEAARSLQREKEFWEQSTVKWREDHHKEAEKRQELEKKKRGYLKDLQVQMEQDEIRLRQNREEEQRGEGEEGETSADDPRAARLEKIKEKKLQQLKAYNVPEKYIKEIEKKFQGMSKNRFSMSYFGKK